MSLCIAYVVKYTTTPNDCYHEAVVTTTQSQTAAVELVVHQCPNFGKLIGVDILPDQPAANCVDYLVKYTTTAYGCYREIVITTSQGQSAAAGLARDRCTDFGTLISVEPWDGSEPPDRAPDGYPC